MNRIIKVFVFLILSLGFISCDREENTLCSLKIYVRLDKSDGTPIKYAVVGLAESQQKFDQGFYINEARAGQDGIIIFSDLNPRTYYFDCIHLYNGREVYGKGNIILRPGANESYTLVVK